MQPADLTSWNDILRALPLAHVLQTRAWAAVKARFGWQPEPHVWHDDRGRVIAAAMLLRRRLPWPGGSVLYAPKGPLLRSWHRAAWRERVLADLARYARDTGALFLKIDPDVVVGTGIPGTATARETAVGQAVRALLARRGWRFSAEQVQFRNTVCLDLRPDEAALLAAMKQKTRYNIRLAARKGVRVRSGQQEDLPLLYRMYAETAARDGFLIRPQAYYLTAWQTMMEADLAEPLIAEVEGEAVAGLILFRFAGRAYYFYGMSTGRHRNKMPSYALQWKAIRRAKAAGCRWYDFWGAPDTFQESDRMWGVFRFKMGFGAQVVRTLGAWDFPARPWGYRGYTRVWPLLLTLWRRGSRPHSAHA